MGLAVDSQHWMEQRRTGRPSIGISSMLTEENRKFLAQQMSEFMAAHHISDETAAARAGVDLDQWAAMKAAAYLVPLRPIGPLQRVVSLVLAVSPPCRKEPFNG